jgi:hypothetical protein
VACRELEKKEDERIAKEQELIRQREEAEMRRERGLPASPQRPAAKEDSPPIRKKSLFRAPSPIIDFNQQQQDDMTVGEPIPIERKENAKRRLFSPPASQQGQPAARAVSPPLPASKSNRRNMMTQGMDGLIYFLIFEH